MASMATGWQVVIGTLFTVYSFVGCWLGSFVFRLCLEAKRSGIGLVWNRIRLGLGFGFEFEL